MEEKITCFQWHSHVSDYLDGTTSETIKRKSDEHLELCKNCSETLKHYQIILNSLSNLPQNELPIPLRKAPLSAALPEVEAHEMRISRWEQIPWSIRVCLQSLGMLSFILLLTSSAPYLRGVYENYIKKIIQKFQTDLVEREELISGMDALPLLQPKANQSRLEEEELLGESENDEKISVGSSQLWRFTIKTVSPEEMRLQVVRVLKELNVSDEARQEQKVLDQKAKDELSGVLVPGGIEFDLVVSQEKVPEIKKHLEKLAPIDSDDFSWYRVKSRKKIPSGTSQVVIWLFQPN